MRQFSWIGKHLIPLVLGLAILMQALNRDLVAAAFYLNQRYIAENLCENTTRPDMHCNGICQLKKALKKVADKEKQASSSTMKQEVQICEPWSEIRLPAPLSARTSYQYPVDYLFSPSRMPNEVFRPPIGG